MVCFLLRLKRDVCGHYSKTAAWMMSPPNNETNYISGKQLQYQQVTYNLVLVVVTCIFNDKPTECDQISSPLNDKIHIKKWRIVNFHSFALPLTFCDLS